MFIWGWLGAQMLQGTHADIWHGVKLGAGCSCSHRAGRGAGSAGRKHSAGTHEPKCFCGPPALPSPLLQSAAIWQAVVLQHRYFKCSQQWHCCACRVLQCSRHLARGSQVQQASTKRSPRMRCRGCFMAGQCPASKSSS